MPWDNPEKLAYTYKNLPWRRPRGSVENVIRMFVFHQLYKGLSRDEAKQIAIEKAQKLGYNIDNLVLWFSGE